MILLFDEKVRRDIFNFLFDNSLIKQLKLLFNIVLDNYINNIVFSYFVSYKFNVMISNFIFVLPKIQFSFLI